LDKTMPKTRNEREIAGYRDVLNTIHKITYINPKARPTDRPMTTPLFLLRCVQLGISIRDLDLLTIGLVNDMYAENSDDDYKGYKKWRLRRTSTNFNQLVDFGV
ncbi:MAG: hypothetical protein V8T24_09410, partial [Roseburia hominis]